MSDQNETTAKKGVMERFVDSKFMKFLQKMGQKAGANKGISAITGAMMGLMGIIMVGAIFNIVASVPASFGWVSSTGVYHSILIAPYNMTMNLISVYLVFLIGYNFGRSLKLKPLNTAIGALATFLLVAAPAATYTTIGSAAIGTDGKTIAGQIVGSVVALDTNYLGAYGMFLAIIIGLCVPGIYYFCHHFHIEIKMPDVVPQFLVDGFSGIIPLLFSIVGFYGLDVLLRYCANGLSLSNMMIVIFKYGFGWLDSLPGMFFLSILCMLLWFFGIHGTMIVYVIIMTTIMMAVTKNYTAYATAGNDVSVLTYKDYFSYTFLASAVSTCGGSGNTLPLVIMCMCSKSKQLKAVGRASIVPGLFGVNEPMTFGVPLMYNPLMMIPFIFNPILVMLALWGLYACGFFKVPYIMIGSLMPIGAGEFLGALAWQNIFIPVVAFVIAGAFYFPFFKVYEKKLIAQEAATAAAEKAAAEAAAVK
jgi:PTS system cellobiose-specific IIC component